MKTKHTPGPWEVTLNKGSEWMICDANGDSITAIPHNDEFFVASDGANAQLIAAAPDLLECLDAIIKNYKVLNDSHFSGPSERLFEMSQEALAKARGEL